MTIEIIYPNPPKVKELLEKYHKLLINAMSCRDEANKLSGGLLEEATLYEGSAADVKEEMRSVVEAEGNYKDNYGNEARIEERVSVSYDVKTAKEYWPSRVLSMVIVEAVDTVALKGLLKGKLVTEDELKPARIEKITKAFIVR